MKLLTKARRAEIGALFELTMSWRVRSALSDLLAEAAELRDRLRESVEACKNYAYGRKDSRECEGEMKDVITRNADLPEGKP